MNLQTLGYDFRPWTGAKSIADGSEIREFIRDTIEQEELSELLWLSTRVIRAEFSSETALWTLTASRCRSAAGGRRRRRVTRSLFHDARFVRRDL